VNQKLSIQQAVKKMKYLLLVVFLFPMLSSAVRAQLVGLEVYDIQRDLEGCFALLEDPDQNIPILLHAIKKSDITKVNDASLVVTLADGFLGKKRSPELAALLVDRFVDLDTHEVFRVVIADSTEIFSSEKETTTALDFFLESFDEDREAALLQNLAQAFRRFNKKADKHTLQVLHERLPRLLRSKKLLAFNKKSILKYCSQIDGAAEAREAFLSYIQSAPPQDSLDIAQMWEILSPEEKKKFKKVYITRFDQWVRTMIKNLEKTQFPVESYSRRVMIFRDHRPELIKYIGGRLVAAKKKEEVQFLVSCYRQLAGVALEIDENTPVSKRQEILKAVSTP